MRIRVKGYLTFREVIGNRQLEFPERDRTTIYDLLGALAREIGDEFADLVFEPGTGQLSPYVAVLVNGRHYSHLPERLETALSDHDEVAIFPPISGG